MAFFRYKTIKGKRYCYIVESYWQDGTCKQKVLAYLGTADSLLKRLKKRGEQDVLSEEKDIPY